MRSQVQGISFLPAGYLRTNLEILSASRRFFDFSCVVYCRRPWLGDRTADVFEQRLMERFRQGDAEAMSTLFEMHVDRVYAYARHLVGSREDAEEITSEAFIRALRN